MEIIIQEYISLNNAIPLINISDIEDGDRVFYELGSYTKSYPSGKWIYSSWKRNGIFKEITDINDWIEKDEYLNNN